MRTSYTQLLQIPYSEVDSHYRLRPDYVISHFQDITGLHSHEMGVDGPTMLAQSNAFWVLSKIKLKILAFPRFDETVELETWPLVPHGYTYLRDYVIRRDGKDILLGTSEWCTLDYTDQKPRRVQSVCYQIGRAHV